VPQTEITFDELDCQILKPTGQRLDYEVIETAERGNETENSLQCKLYMIQRKLMSTKEIHLWKTSRAMEYPVTQQNGKKWKNLLGTYEYKASKDKKKKNREWLLNIFSKNTGCNSILYIILFKFTLSTFV
jgi:hypothetical protein